MTKLKCRSLSSLIISKGNHGPRTDSFKRSVEVKSEGSGHNQSGCNLLKCNLGRYLLLNLNAYYLPWRRFALSEWWNNFVWKSVNN